MFDKDKFKALVHYICYNRSLVDPKSLGAVKLNKVLWLSDFLCYYRFDHSLTGATYVKRQHGPVPRQILPILQELALEGKVFVHEAPYFGKMKKSFEVKQVAPTDFLQPEERELVDKLIKFVCEQHTAASISELSHDHIWKAAKEGEEIPVHTIFANPGEITAEDREWARQQLETCA